MKRRLGVAALLVALAACTAEQPAPPKFEDTDPCTLLASGDAGSLTGTSKGTRACDFTFDSLTVRLVLRTEKFADASQKLLSGGGYGAVVNDHPMTRRCTDASGTVTCEGLVEARDGQLIELTVVQRSNDSNMVGQTTQGLAAKALERLPVTS
ncbi:hypothetical protein [Lentzea nigeriaca]|uniref:hypothetical protein n=1 Tax=Lentzea nigeriaca TaxID=1128665 RepID=UPI00195CF290|nr:hypothetical protein [Lentzea nigeriaca]MBM7859394.1 hypothetical protein [Lentzea nigeriaca]